MAIDVHVHPRSSDTIFAEYIERGPGSGFAVLRIKSGETDVSIFGGPHDFDKLAKVAEFLRSIVEPPVRCVPRYEAAE